MKGRPPLAPKGASSRGRPPDEALPHTRKEFAQLDGHNLSSSGQAGPQSLMNETNEAQLSETPACSFVNQYLRSSASADLGSAAAGEPPKRPREHPRRDQAGRIRPPRRGRGPGYWGRGPGVPTAIGHRSARRLVGSQMGAARTPKRPRYQALAVAQAGAERPAGRPVRVAARGRGARFRAGPTRDIASRARGS